MRMIIILDDIIHSSLFATEEIVIDDEAHGELYQSFNEFVEGQESENERRGFSFLRSRPEGSHWQKRAKKG